MTQLPTGTLPISAGEWQMAVSGISWEDHAARLDAAHSAVVAASLAEDAAALKKSVGDLASAVEGLSEDLWCLAALRSGLSDAVAQAQSAVINEALRLIEAVCSAPRYLPRSPYNAEPRIPGQKEIEREAPDAVDDPCLAAFGVPLTTAKVGNMISADRVMTAWYGRTLALQRRMQELIAPIAYLPADLPLALRATMGLVLSNYPLQAVRAARAVYNLIIEAADNEPAPAAAILRNLYLETDRSAANHEQVRRTWRELTSANTSKSASAIATLQWYRQISEGQIRRWAGTYLALKARRPGRTPELGEIVARLEADGSALAMDMRRALLPNARNAAAHEDYFYDKRREVLVGDADLDPKELLNAGLAGMSVVFGAEAGWACANAARPEFASSCHTDVKIVPLADTERRARAKVASNGLALRALDYEDRIVTLTIDSVPADKTNHLFQAIIEICMLLGDAESVRVYTALSDAPVIAVEVEPIIATAHLWDAAQRTFTSIPCATFLPLIGAARLTVEASEAAASAVAWLGLNDALMALWDPTLNSHTGQSPLQAAYSWMSLISASLGASASMPALTAAGNDIGEARAVIDAVRGDLAKHESWPRSQAIAQMASRIDQMRVTHRVPSILPTYDPRPIEP